MSDLIDRQDAIDAIMSEPPDAHYPSWYADVLKGLSSACNEAKRQATVSSDCISRQAAIDEIHEDADWLAAQGSDWQVERVERDKSILMSLPSAEPEHLVKESGDLVKDLVNDCINRQDAIDAINAYLGLSAVSRTIQNMTSIQEILENLPSASTDLSTFSDKLWKTAYERGKAEGRTEAWEFAIDAYYGTTKEQELFECLTFTQAKTEREELGKCEEKNNAGQIFVELANHINRCINDAVKKTREGEEE